MTRSFTQTSTFLLLACLSLATLSDILFYHHPWGCNAALFSFALIVTLIARAPGLWRSWIGRTGVVLAGIALFSLIEEPSPLAMIIVITTIGTLALLAQRNLGRRLSDWASHWLHLLVTMPLRLILDKIIASRWLTRHPHLRRTFSFVRAIAWWIFPLLGGSVFLVLFSFANPIIETWIKTAIDNLWAIFDWLPYFLAPDRIFLWGAVALCSYGLLRYRRLRITRRETPLPITATAPHASWLTGHAMIIRCLIVFNAVFALQSILDIIYLFGGAKLPPGMTYPSYAHRGAYPLVATALLAGLFVLITFRSGGPAHRSIWARRLVYLWIGQNLLLMVTTIWRLFLYVDVDGLTRLRVSTMIWLFLVALGFCWIITKIARSLSNEWLWRMNVLTLFFVLYLCAFVNFDGIIADYNVRHCREFTGRGFPIELPYLQHLGPDALPALILLQNAPPHSAIPKPQVDDMIRDMQNELAADLSNWRGWTWRRAREQAALNPSATRSAPEAAKGGYLTAQSQIILPTNR